MKIVASSMPYTCFGTRWKQNFFGSGLEDCCTDKQEPLLFSINYIPTQPFEASELNQLHSAYMLSKITYYFDIIIYFELMLVVLDFFDLRKLLNITIDLRFARLRYDLLCTLREIAALIFP